MPDYEKMYAVLCAAASDALDALPETAENAAGRRNCISTRKNELQSGGHGPPLGSFFRFGRVTSQSRVNPP